jgi:hypothetical protein
MRKAEGESGSAYKKLYTSFISFKWHRRSRNYEECYATFHGLGASRYTRTANAGVATIEGQQSQHNQRGSP